MRGLRIHARSLEEYDRAFLKDQFLASLQGKAWTERDDAVQGFMTKHSVPAASIAVTHGEKLIYLKAYGLQDKEASQAATPQSLFRLASVSKQLTSASSGHGAADTKSSICSPR